MTNKTLKMGKTYKQMFQRNKMIKYENMFSNIRNQGLQMKTTMIYHFKPLRLVKNKETDKNQCQKIYRKMLIFC